MPDFLADTFLTSGPVLYIQSLTIWSVKAGANSLPPFVVIMEGVRDMPAKRSDIEDEFFYLLLSGDICQQEQKAALTTYAKRISPRSDLNRLQRPHLGKETTMQQAPKKRKEEQSITTRGRLERQQDRPGIR